MVISTDPDVESAGIDAGFELSRKTLRAPDVAVDVPDQPGWVKGPPRLAVEYVALDSDSYEVEKKIQDLLIAGTKWVWVVRFEGAQHAEVHEKGKQPHRRNLGDSLEAPGVLRNSVPVEALFDRQAARQAMLENLLQREGIKRGIQHAILVVLESRGVPVSDETRARIAAESHPGVLEKWISRAAVATSERDVFLEPELENRSF